MSQIKSLNQLQQELSIATEAEAAARAAYDLLEGSTNPDRAALAAAQDKLGDAVLAEDQARAALNAALEAEEA